MCGRRNEDSLCLDRASCGSRKAYAYSAEVPIAVSLLHLQSACIYRCRSGGCVSSVAFVEGCLLRNVSGLLQLLKILLLPFGHVDSADRVV